MKVCRICKLPKPINEFYPRSNGQRRAECRNCKSTISQKQYENRKLRTKVTISNKVCSHCQTDKSSSEFRKHPSNSDGLYKFCKDCASKYHKSPTIQEYLKQKKESGRQKQILDKYRSTHKERINSRVRDRHKETLIQDRLEQIAIRLDKRQKAIDTLGGECCVCGENNILKLCIDHVHDDGAIERKQINFRQLVSRIITSKIGLDKYQVLCFNCNRKKQNHKYKTIDKNDCPDILDTKVCTQCRQNLPIGMFAKTVHKSSGRIPYCKQCACVYILNRKIKVFSLFNSQCQICKCTDVDILEIDHINNDGHEKRRSGHDISLYLRLLSGERSIDGLQLLCANCNAEKAYKQIPRPIVQSVRLNKPDKLVDFSFRDIKMARTHENKFQEFLKTYHYAGVGRSWKAVYLAILNDVIIGVVKFATVVRREVATSMDLSPSVVLELDRFCIHSEYQAKNLASFIMSRVIRLVKTDFPEIKTLVSFADSAQGHVGTIYKASNWKYVSRTGNSYIYKRPDGTFLNKKTMFNQAKKLGLTERQYQSEQSLERVILPPKTKYKFDFKR